MDDINIDGDCVCLCKCRDREREREREREMIVIEQVKQSMSFFDKRDFFNNDTFWDYELHSKTETNKLSDINKENQNS